MTEMTETSQPADGSPSKIALPEPVLLQPHATRFPLVLLLSCLAIELTIYVLDYFLHYSRMASDPSIQKIFSTTIEDGIASWASQTQTMLVAVTLWFIVVIHRAKRASWWTLLGWAILALFFTYMSMDDGAKMHERIGSTLRRMQDDRGYDIKSFFPSYSWQFFILPFFALMGMYMLVFLWFQMRDLTSRVLVLCAMLMLVIAVGIDFIEGLDKNHDWNIYRIIADGFELDDYCRAHFRKSGYTAVKHFFKSAEECFMEMGANSVLWFLFLRYLVQKTGRIEIRFRRGPKERETLTGA